MKIIKLQLVNYRNQPKTEMGFGSSTAIIGPNGVGKTNLIEAIRYGSIMKAYRAKNLAEAIKKGSLFSTLNLEIKTKDRNQKITIAIEGGVKSVKVNNIKKPIAQAVGVLKTVLFAPDDLDFISGPPATKRKFINTLISQRDFRYLTALLELNKIIQNRNATLTRLAIGQGNATELEIWDDRLIALSNQIHPKREDVIEKINLNLSNYYRQISGNDTDELTIKYNPSWVDEKILASAKTRDIRFQKTHNGPHQDDIKIYLNNNDLSIYGSRGEKRSGLLAVKLSEIESLNQDDPPVLLVDDALSEFDSKRQSYLLRIIKNQQTIITATRETEEIRQACDKIIRI